MWHYNLNYKHEPSKNPRIWTSDLIRLAEKRCISIANKNDIQEAKAMKCMDGKLGCK